MPPLTAMSATQPAAPLSEEAAKRNALWREGARNVGLFSLAVGGLTLAILGGLSGGAVLLGVGLGICISLTVAALWVRERNLMS